MLKRIALSGCFCFVLLSPSLAEQGANEKNAPSHGAVIDVGPSISAPQPVFAPDPEYPISFRKHKIQGICVLGVTVGEDGDVRDVHVTRSLDKRLDQNAIDAVKRWKFRPAMRNGKPVAVKTSIEVGFRLY